MPPISSRTQTIPAGTYKWIKPYTGVDDSLVGYIQLDSPFTCDGTSYGSAIVSGTYLQYGAGFYPYSNGVWVDTKYQTITFSTNGEWIVQGFISTWDNS